MTETSYDFFLTTEHTSGPLAKQRGCKVLTYLESPTNQEKVYQDNALVEMEIFPDIDSESDQKQFGKLLLSPKWPGYNLKPITSWPVPVYVYTIEWSKMNDKLINLASIRMYSWGILYSGRKLV